MANFFDQFDAPPAQGPPVGAPPPSQDAGKNFFDQFDEKPAAGTAAPQRSGLGEFLTGFENAGAAAGQLTTPNIAAHAPNYLGPATITEEGDVGYKDAQGNFVATDKNKHVVLTDPADRTPKIYARTEATDEGRLSAAGRFIGTGLGASTLPAAGPVALSAGAAAAKSIGATVPRAVTSHVPGMNFLGQLSMKAPGGGPLYKAVGGAVEDVGAAVPAAVEKAGGAASADAAGAAFREGVATRFGKELPDAVSRRYDMVDKFVDPAVRTELENTRGAIADIMARRANYGAEGMPKAVSEVIDSVQKPGGINYEGVKNLRSAIGELMQKTPEGMSQTQLKQIYSTLSDDLRAAVEAGGGKQGLAAFERANAAARRVSQWEETVGKVLGTDTRSNEGVADTIRRMAGSGSTADIQTLAQARAAVPAEAWQKIAANVVGGLGKDRKGDFSPAIFLNDYEKLSDPGKRLLFHSVGSGDLLPHLDSIAKVSEDFVRAGKLANTSGTASHGVAYGALGVIGAKLMEGDLVTPLVILGAGVGNNLLARWLSNPATAASTARWAQAYSRYVSNPKGSLNTLQAATRNLAVTAAPRSPDDLSRRITDAVPQRP
jgi:hypothetical protein